MKKIEKLLEGNLNETEAIALRREIESDPKLNEALTFEESLIEGIQLNAASELKNNLDVFHQELEKEHPEYFQEDEANVENLAVELEMNMAELFDNLSNFLEKINSI